ncbi:hypothetical protein LTS10_013326 [Elasticomyces elasticus]|nr:hypothetical protein LTS10_013326 [Elasticomyces elasticus]
MDESQADMNNSQDHGSTTAWPNSLDYANGQVNIQSTAAESYHLGAAHRDVNNLMGSSTMNSARDASARVSAYDLPQCYGQGAHNQHETVEQYLLREFASGQPLEMLAEAIYIQHGQRMTIDELLVMYRVAFWRMRSWEESDTNAMEQIVREELHAFWERVARRMHERGGREWPPNEIKMSYVPTMPIPIPTPIPRPAPAVTRLGTTPVEFDDKAHYSSTMQSWYHAPWFVKVDPTTGKLQLCCDWQLAPLVVKQLFKNDGAGRL